MRKLLFLLFFVAVWSCSCSREIDEVPANFSEPETTFDTEPILNDNMEPDPHDSTEYRELMERRENLATSEEVRQWREDLNTFYDTYFGRIEEPEPPEPVSEPVTRTAEYYSGEFKTGHKGDFNKDVEIELEVSVELPQTVYRRGDKVMLLTGVKNIGSAFMYFPNYVSPDAFLRHEEYTNGKSYSSGYTTYSIYRGDVPLPEGVPDEELCEMGDTWSNRIEIRIPENAQTGMYDVMVFTHGYTAIVKDALEIIE